MTTTTASAAEERAPDWRPLVAATREMPDYDAAYRAACAARRPLVCNRADQAVVTATLETVGPDLDSWRLTPEQAVAMHRAADQAGRETRQRRGAGVCGGSGGLIAYGFGLAGRALLAERWAGVLSCSGQDHRWTDEERSRERRLLDDYFALLKSEAA